MKLSHTIRVVAATATLAALAAPAIASAHPGVYVSQTRLAKTAAQQTITVDATGGAFKPSANAGTVAYPATAAQVFAGLRQDPAILDDVAVTGPTGGPYSLTFIGRLAGTAVTTVAPNATGLTGGAGTAVATVDKVGGTSVVSPTAASEQAVQVQYVVANDGYTASFTENNGVSTATEGGQLNYKAMASAYRAPLSSAQKLVFPTAQTDLQVHATCLGVAALQDPANIDLAEPGNGADPYYNYIPWQSASAGMGDSASVWIAAVKTITNGLPGAPAGGVDLTGMTVPQATAACTAVGGTYRAADTKSAIATALIADAVAPLNTQITTLGDQVTALQNDKTTLQTAKDAADQAKAAAEQARDAAVQAKDAADANAATANADKTAAQGQVDGAKAEAAKAKADLESALGRPLELTIADKVFAGGAGVALVTGKAGASVKVTVELSASAAKKLGVSSRTVASTTTTLGAQGAKLVSLKPGKSVAKALTKKKGSFAVTVSATADGTTKTASASLTR